MTDATSHRCAYPKSSSEPVNELVLGFLCVSGPRADRPDFAGRDDNSTTKMYKTV